MEPAAGCSSATSNQLFPMTAQPKITQSMANTLVLTCAYAALFAGYVFLFTTYRSGPDRVDPAAVHQEATSTVDEQEALVQR